MIKHTNVLHEKDPRYRGEAFPIDTEGTAKIETYTPGKLDVSYALKTPGKILINTNLSNGWIAGPPDHVLQNDMNLLVVQTANSKGNLSLSYVPPYFISLAATYFFGLLITLLNFIYLVRSEKI